MVFVASHLWSSVRHNDDESRRGLQLGAQRYTFPSIGCHCGGYPEGHNVVFARALSSCNYSRSESTDDIFSEDVGVESDQHINICSFAVYCDRMWPSTQ